MSWRVPLRTWTILSWTSGIYLTEGALERVVPTERHPELVKQYRDRWLKYALPLLGLEPQAFHQDRALERTALHHKPETRGRLIVSNHRSTLDIFTLMDLFRGRFLSNHRTASAPFFGKAATKIGTLYVDRDDPKSGASSVRQMRSLLKSGETLIVFPEGTTYPGDEVREFFKGAFVAAQGLDIDVVPVGLAYPEGVEFVEDTLSQHMKKVFARPKTPVRVAVGDPITGKRIDAEEVRQEVAKLVGHARRRL